MFKIRLPNPSPQVGEEENLRPFVISVGLQCKLDETAPLVLEKDKTEIRDSRPVDPARERVVRSVGVGDCKVIVVGALHKCHLGLVNLRHQVEVLHVSQIFTLLVLHIVCV